MDDRDEWSHIKRFIQTIVFVMQTSAGPYKPMEFEEIQKVLIRKRVTHVVENINKDWFVIVKSPDIS